MEITSRQARWEIPGVATLEAGAGGLTKLVISATEGQAEIYLHGAHVTHFQPSGRKPVLFLSQKSLFEADKPIRGGIPLIFPWFGPNTEDPSAPMHGFARVKNWEVINVSKTSAGDVSATFELTSRQPMSKVWPHSFQLQYTVRVGRELSLTLSVKNLSSKAFSFEEAFHTYLAVSDVRQSRIEGLAGHQYIDKVDQFQIKTQGAGPIAIEGETDRVYLDTADVVCVQDPVLDRELRVRKIDSQSTVLWNPWIAKAKAMADFGDEEWPGMVCVETANVGKNKISLPAGATHEMRAIISAH